MKRLMPLVLDIIFGKAKRGGKIPFELPSSVKAARNKKRKSSLRFKRSVV